MAGSRWALCALLLAACVADAQMMARAEDIMDALLRLRLGPRPDRRARPAAETEDSRAETRSTLARIQAGEAVGGVATEPNTPHGASSMEVESAAGGAVRVEEQRAQPTLEDASLHLRAARHVGRPGASILGRMLATSATGTNGGGPAPGEPTVRQPWPRADTQEPA